MKKLLLLYILISLSVLIYSQGYWEEIQNTGAYGYLNKCAFTDSLTGWVVGQHGIIEHTSDGGQNWELQYYDDNKMFNSVSFINDNEGWVVGWSDIMHTTDGGQNWDLQTDPSTMGDYLDVYFLNENNGWVVGYYRIILRTTDGGHSWEKISNQIPNETNYTAIKFFDANNGILCGYQKDVGGVTLITNDGGLNWTDTSPEQKSNVVNRFNALDINDSGEVFVCGTLGSIYKSTDMGNTWTDLSTNSTTYIDVEFEENQTGYLLSNSQVLKTTDNGETWEYYTNNPSFSTINDLNISENCLFTCGYYTEVYKYDNENNNWEELLYNNPSKFQELNFTSETEGFAIMGNSFLGSPMKTVDGGYTWADDTLVPEQSVYQLQGVGQTLYYLSSYRHLLKSTDAGQNWETLDLPDYSSLFNDMSVPDENTLYLCDDSSTLFKSIDGGNTWNQLTFSEYHNFTTSYFYDSNFGWLIDAASAKLYRTTDGGISWKRKIVDQNNTYLPTQLYFINQDTGFVFNEQGWVYRTTDGGDFWTKVFDANYSFKPNFHFINENTGYLFVNYKIFITEDGGITWSDYQTLTQNITCAAFYNNFSYLGGFAELCAVNSDILSIDDGIANSNIGVYPNPTSGKIVVNDNNVSELVVFNSAGIRILTEENQSNIDLSKLPKGIYFVKIVTKTSTRTEKIILQ